MTWREAMSLKSFAAASSVAIVALAAPPVAAAQPTPVDPWAGLYVGIGGHVGEAFGGNKLSFVDLSTTHDLSFDFVNQDKPLVGGGGLGQLWPLGGIYVRLEGDASFRAQDIKSFTTVRAQRPRPAP